MNDTASNCLNEGTSSNRTSNTESFKEKKDLLFRVCLGLKHGQSKAKYKMTVNTINHQKK